MYTLRSTLLPTRYDAIVSYGHANMIRRQVVDICRELMKDEAKFNQLGDRGWVVLSLAEAYQGLDRKSDEAGLAAQIESLASLFGKDTYGQQRQRLQDAIDKFHKLVRPEELQTPLPTTIPAFGRGTAAANEPPQLQGVAAAAMAVVRPAGPGQPITIDPGILPGRTVRSIEVSCKVEYD
jgi:hypothetical protein